MVLSALMKNTQQAGCWVAAEGPLRDARGQISETPCVFGRRSLVVAAVGVSD